MSKRPAAQVTRIKLTDEMHAAELAATVLGEREVEIGKRLAQILVGRDKIGAPDGVPVAARAAPYTPAELAELDALQAEAAGLEEQREITLRDLRDAHDDELGRVRRNAR
jgi:hypothetical protein